MLRFSIGFCLFAAFAVTWGNTAGAANFHIDYYKAIQSQGNQEFTFGAQTINTAHKVVGDPFIVGTIEINDAALGVPNAFIPLDSPDLIGFSADFGSNSFELPGDPLRLVEAGRPADEQLGVRLDGNGKLLRFDIPRTSFSNEGAIWDDDPALTFPRNSLTLIDENPDGSEAYFVEQGGELFILGAQQTDFFGFTETPIGEDTIITALGMSVLGGQVGEWRIDGPASNPLDNVEGFLRIDPEPIPLPAAVWLLLSGLGAIAGVGWRRKAAS